MNLNDFEQYSNEVIVSRGKDYYEWQHVNAVQESRPGHYTAIVNGSEEYHIEVKMDEAENIQYSSCNCPYDVGDICKHEAAVFFALRNRNASFAYGKDRKEPALQDLLQGLTKQDLIQIVVEYADRNAEMEQELRLHYGPQKSGVSASKELIQQYIELAEVDGFVHFRNASRAVKGAELVLEKMEESIDDEEIKMAVLLGETVLSEMIDLLQYCDDSGGDVGMVIEEALDKIDIAILRGEDILSDSEKREIVQKLIEVARQDKYKGWNDWRFTLLQCCVPFCHLTDCRTMLEEELETILTEKNSDNWSASFDREQIKLIQLDLIEQFDPVEKREAFLESNIDSSKFRKRVIHDNVDQANYEKVVALCLDGEERDKQYPGLERQWQEYRYQAYEALHDEPNQKSLGMSLLLNGDYDYFLKIKQLYSEKEWPQVLEYITDHLSQTGFNGNVYVRILKEEGLTEKLLAYCQNHPGTIADLYPHLQKEYPEHVTDIFIEFIHVMAERSSNRKGYRDVCRVIKTFRKACGQEKANVIIKELESKYYRKPAFLDELARV
ncbi:SWIM zinc finger family protein [Gracilibacillus salinarum]|uniref:SWIM-type domain-containing protein n=1 Tax=Gracilibacillus salinarum TaxID=2932255 RepID=A0ABY4GHA7_9BACI|nr:hypothetical protein [Gracilibacillus salinarum]UOQ83595.1 hypothetical protein MUN87_12600 [Gracilibacillus salinarum]